MTDIRVVAPALKRSDVVALGEFETTVHLYEITPLRASSTISTVLSFGGDRLALCTPGESLVVVAAAWERHGVCGYDAAGERLWQRKDLKRAGPLSPAGDGSLVAVALDRRSLQILDAATGASLASVRGVKGVWQSRHHSLAAAGSYKEIALLETHNWKRTWTVPVDGFALLDVAFAVDGLLASDSGDAGRIYAFGLDGRQRWSQQLADEMLCWALAWDDTSDEWVGLAHHVNRATPDLLMRWARDGRALSALPLPSVTAAAFLPGGVAVVTDRGVVDARTGVVHPLPPPGARDINQR